MDFKEFHQKYTELVGGMLEIWVHHILYVRHVYPKTTFTTTKFYGVTCYVNRHPSVVDYIAQTIHVAVPTLVALGQSNQQHQKRRRQSYVSDTTTTSPQRTPPYQPTTSTRKQKQQKRQQQFVLSITDTVSTNYEDTACITNTPTEIERYVLQFSDYRKTSSMNNTVPVSVLEELRRSMRDIIISIHTLESNRASSNSMVSFELFLNTHNVSCNELQDGFRQGLWHMRCADDDDDDDSSDGVIDVDIDKDGKSVATTTMISTPSATTKSAATGASSIENILLLASSTTPPQSQSSAATDCTAAKRKPKGGSNHYYYRVARPLKQIHHSMIGSILFTVEKKRKRIEMTK